MIQIPSDKYGHDLLLSLNNDVCSCEEKETLQHRLTDAQVDYFPIICLKKNVAKVSSQGNILQLTDLHATELQHICIV